MSVSAGTQGVSDVGGFNVATDDAATAARLSQIQDAQANLARAFADLKVGRDAVEAQANARAQKDQIIEEANKQAQCIMNAARIKARMVLEQAAATIALVDDPEAFDKELDRLVEMLK